MLSINIEYLETLRGLGLTKVQAKVFLTNFSIGPATVKQIAFQANTAREDVYRTLPSLQDLGLIKKHIVSPAIYETIDIGNALDLLIKQKKKKTESVIQSATNLYLQIFDQNREKKSWINFENELILLSNIETIDLSISREFRNVKQSLDITINWNCFRQKARTWEKKLIKNLDSGLKMRVITNFPHEDTSVLLKSTKKLMEHPNLEAKYIEKPPQCIISLYDNTRGFIFNSRDNNFNPPALWTNNPTFLRLIKCYFETTWKSALELTCMLTHLY